MDQNKAVARVSMVITRELDMVRLMGRVMDEARQLLKAESCNMYVCDHRKGELWSTYADAQITHLALGVGTAGSCAETGTIVNISQAEEDPLVHADPVLAKGTKLPRNILCAPIKSRHGAAAAEAERELEARAREYRGHSAGRHKRLPKNSSRHALVEESDDDAVVIGVIQVKCPTSVECLSRLLSLCELPLLLFLLCLRC